MADPVARAALRAARAGTRTPRAGGSAATASDRRRRAAAASTAACAATRAARDRARAAPPRASHPCVAAARARPAAAAPRTKSGDRGGAARPTRPRPRAARGEVREGELVELRLAGPQRGGDPAQAPAAPLRAPGSPRARAEPSAANAASRTAVDVRIGEPPVARARLRSRQLRRKSSAARRAHSSRAREPAARSALARDDRRVGALGLVHLAPQPQLALQPGDGGAPSRSRADPSGDRLALAQRADLVGARSRSSRARSRRRRPSSRAGSARRARCG